MKVKKKKRSKSSNGLTSIPRFHVNRARHFTSYSRYTFVYIIYNKHIESVELNGMHDDVSTGENLISTFPKVNEWRV